MAKQKREQAVIEATNFVYLHLEGPSISGMSFPTLWRHFQQGRLKAYGLPLKCDYDHLIDQARNDFPKLMHDDCQSPPKNKGP